MKRKENCFEMKRQRVQTKKQLSIYTREEELNTLMADGSSVRD